MDRNRALPSVAFRAEQSGDANCRTDAGMKQEARVTP